MKLFLNPSPALPLNNKGRVIDYVEGNWVKISRDMV